jgi:type II secretory pathway component PulC
MVASASGSPRTHAAPAAPAGKSYHGKVTLPDGGSLELGGIVWSEQDPRALVNDRVVGVGAYVQGYTIETIQEDRVVLEKDGKRITVTVK